MNKKNRYILGAFFVLAFLLRIFYISRANGPIVYADELGYWGHAANLTGNAWGGVMNGMPWYACGYSLLLVPVFLLSTDIVIMYRLAIILNCVLGLLSFGMVYKMIRKLEDGRIDVPKAAVYAFVITSYSAYIFQSYIAWSETLLSCLIWLILYEMILLEETPKYWKSILLGVTVGYSYMVHNRMLAVVAAVVLILLFLLYRRKINVKHLLCVAGMLVITLFVCAEMREYLSGLLRNNAMLQKMDINIGFSTANTLSEQVAKIRTILTLDGFKKFMINIAGQMWHLLSATYLLAGLGMIYGIKKLFEAMKKGQSVIFYLFPLCTVLFTILMTSLFFIDNRYDTQGERVRIDTLFYGRYNDILVGFLILMALLCLFSHIEIKTYIKYVLTVGLIYLVLSFIMYYNLKDIEHSYLNTVSAASIHIFHWLGEFDVWKCTLIAFSVSAAYLVCNFIKLPKQINIYLICLLLVFLFATTALKCMRLIISGENDYTQQYEEIYAFLNENTEEKEYVFTLAAGKFAYDLQTRLADRAVTSIDSSQIDYVDDHQYIVMSEQEYNDFTSIGIKRLQTEGYVIIQKMED